MEIFSDDWTFYKFRYTLPEGKVAREYTYLLTVLIGTENFESDAYYATAGYETLNKLNEPTNPHIHIHFAVKNKTEGAIRKAFQRWAKSLDETRKGNALYALAEEEDVKDYKRFFRYAWKQGGRLDRSKGGFFERLPPDMDINLEIALAKEEQERMWEFNVKKRDKALKPNTKDLLFDYLDALNAETPFQNKKQILIKIMEYYNQEDKSANKMTILGYLQTAMWRYKLETFEETAESWLN